MNTLTSTLFTDISELVTNDSELDRGDLGIISDAAILVDGSSIAWVGPKTAAPAADSVVHVNGAVIPGFVDSHAHLVFAGDRAAEFEARMRGEKYSAGGIRSTVAATRAASDAELRARVKSLANELAASGVAHFECKSGYGLSREDELRSIAIAREFTPDVTLLAAHVVPQEFVHRRYDYVDLAKSLSAPALERGARWVDVFCDAGAFTVDEAREILTAGQMAGLLPRMHANQLANIGAIELAVELDCASADHCTHLTDRQVELVAASETVVTLLPGAEFSTRSQAPNARRLLDAGVKIALATDCNPGSSYTTSMPFVMAVAIREMRLTPAEALQAATVGGARALRQSDLGRIKPGYSANLALLRAPSYLHLTYRPGVSLVAQTWSRGKLIWSNNN